MKFFTFNLQTGRIVPGVQLADVDTGGIAVPSLLPQSGIVLLRQGKRRLLPLSAEESPETDNGTLLEAFLGKACAAQEWFDGKGPKSYDILAGVGYADQRIALAVPTTPGEEPRVRILRHPERSGPMWVEHMPLRVDLAPEGAGESLSNGTAYALCELQHFDFTDPDVLRITQAENDWVIELRTKRRHPITATDFKVWEKRESRIAARIDRNITRASL